MSTAPRAQLEVRTVLVTWRSVMRQIHDGRLPGTAESVYRVTSRALAELDNVATAHAADARSERSALETDLSAARREIKQARDAWTADEDERAG